MRFLGLLLALALVPLAARAEGPAAPTAPAPAPKPAPPATCTLKIIQALATPGEIDPKIKLLRAKLQEPPFNTWKTFKVLSEEGQSIASGASARYGAPEGSVTVTYSEHKVKEGGKHAIKATMSVETGKSQTKTTFTLDEGKHFLTVGPKHGEGTLIYSLTCSTPD